MHRRSSDSMDSMRFESVPRRDAAAKIAGTATYAADLTLPGMLYGVTVRSECARGRMLGMDFDPAFPWAECTVVWPEDIPGRNCVTHILDDQPCLAAGEVNHWGEPLLLIAHPDRYVAEEARRHVHVRYELLDAVFDMEHPIGVFREYSTHRGNVETVFDAGGTVVEGEYRTPAVDQVYIEPQAMLVAPSPDRGLSVWGSLQCPYYVHHALMKALGLASGQVRVIQCETGGGFGGKEDYPSVLACHAALLAWKSGCPVKMVYDRAEDLAATTKRHPSRVRHRTAVGPDGQLLAMDIDVLLDGGAYTTLSPVVLSRALIHAVGPYFCPNVRLRGRVVATNHPPHGAFRGFGAPQVCFAVEGQMDRIAAVLGISPVDVRRRNLLRPGQATATGQIMPEDLDLHAMLQRALDLSGFHSKRAGFERENAAGVVKRGIGLSCSFHGSGFTGSGERMLDSVVEVEAVQGGGLRLLVSSVEMGQGAATVLCQLAAESFGCAVENVELATPDTACVPDSGPTVASRTTMVVGALVQRAAGELRAALDRGGGALPESGGPLKARARYQPPQGLPWDDANFSGDAYAAYSWAVDVAEVCVDIDTGETRVEQVTAVVEAGRIVNQQLARGQIEGGILQGAGFALGEETLYERGRVANAQMTNTLIPSAMDAPSMCVDFVEPVAGAAPKGLGELPVDGAAPAIAGALSHATGKFFSKLPLTPESVLEAVNG